MFVRTILAVVVLAAASAQAQLAITEPGPGVWWVANSKNTLAWTCNTAPSTESSFTVVLSNTNTSILVSPLALIPTVPNYMCSYLVSEQLSSQQPSTSWTLSLTNVQNISDIYTSAQFEIKAQGSAYPTVTSAAASGTGTSSGSAAASTSTSTSKTGAAVANYIPVGMSMAAALMLGLVVA